MPFTHKVGITFSNDAGAITTTTDTYLSDSEVNLDEIVVPGATNQEYDVLITVANIKDMVLMSTQPLTVKTNSSSAPQETITLAANKQLVWTVDHPEAKFFAGNITKFFVTNTSALNATLKFRCGLTVGV
jgi:hypothetical protein